MAKPIRGRKWEKSKTKCKKKEKKNPRLVWWTRFVYVLFILIWLAIIIVFELYKKSPIVLLILVIPFVVFLSGFEQAPYSTFSDEQGIFEASFLAIGLLVVVPLINWMRENYEGDCKEFVALILFAISLTLLSVLDIWFKSELMRLNRHIRLCFETMAVTLFIIILYMFYEGTTAEGICGTGKCNASLDPKLDTSTQVGITHGINFPYSPN